MPPQVVTFRAELKSRICDFLADAGMTCSVTEEALVALVVAINDHREEGTPLFPRVIICDDLDAVLRNIQGTGAIRIGSSDRSPETVLRALKKCAPLADRGWAIWIDRKPDTFSYGVFREPSSPTSIDLRRTLIDTDSSGQLRALLVAQIAPGVVELISAGHDLQVHLSGKRADQVVDDAEGRLVEMWAADISDDRLRDRFASFATTLLHDLLRRGHGTLIAVAPSGAAIDFVDDAVLLDDPVDLASLVDNHASDATSEALSDVLDYSQLLAGMMGSDGIVVLDSAGRLLGYHWFVKPDPADASTGDQLGGARHRAFEVLKRLVDKKFLRGAFIRSADGGERAYNGSER